MYLTYIFFESSKLITSLRTAMENGAGALKEATSHDDVFDSFRLNLIFWD